MEDPDPVQERLADAERTVAQLQHALDSRVVIEQAKGVLAERFGMDVDAAFEMLRHVARSQRRLLHELAAAVVDGSENVAPSDDSTGRRQSSPSGRILLPDASADSAV